MIKVKTDKINNFMIINFYLIFNFRQTFFFTFEILVLILFLIKLKKKWSKSVHARGLGLKMSIFV